MNFESNLSEGKFLIPECINCEKIVWPPVEFCHNCFSEVSLKERDFQGEIIEFSRKNNQYFCLVEFADKIRIMADMSETPQIGQKVKISKCGIIDENYFFQVNGI